MLDGDFGYIVGCEECVLGVYACADTDIVSLVRAIAPGMAGCCRFGPRLVVAHLFGNCVVVVLNCIISVICVFIMSAYRGVVVFFFAPKIQPAHIRSPVRGHLVPATIAVAVATICGGCGAAARFGLLGAIASIG